MIEFTVHGIPAPQGSKAPYGGESNPRTRPWRAAVAAVAAETMNGQPLLTGPLKLQVVFVFPRPKSHTGTGRNDGVLKASAPLFHSVKPDTDKLLRAIGDSLSGTVIRDDAQIATVTASKLYGEPACARIVVERLEGA